MIKKKPLKTVTNTVKAATKQSLIYENDGGQKRLRCRKAKKATTRYTVQIVKHNITVMGD